MKNSLVYTSFDGDDMIYIDCMRSFVMQCKLLPINPEHALGYYVSTSTHGNSKREVMKDCLSLMLFSDEMWIFSRDNELRIDCLSEGVIAELLAWINNKSKKARFIAVREMMEELSGKQEHLRRNCYPGTIIEVNADEVRMATSSEYFSEVSAFQSKSLQSLRDIVYIEMGN